MRIFIGIDPRAAVAYNVLQWSIIRRASKPVQIVPLVLGQLPLTRKGLTHFTYSRYLAPWLCNYQGISVFMDSDMLVLGDVYDLKEYADAAVSVVKGKERFEWPSMMVFNNEKCGELTPDFINDENNHPQNFEWADEVGELPGEWNHCVGYDEPCDAKLVHFTMGIPHFPECRLSEYADVWKEEYASMIGASSWFELMGNSVHAKHVLSHLQQNMANFQ
jgi:hypothetical protein